MRMIDYYEFIGVVKECFEGLKYDEEIEAKAKKMIDSIIKIKELSKGYLKHGIL